MNDFAGKGSSRPPRKEVNPNKEIVTNRFLSASDIPAYRREIEREEGNFVSCS